MNKEFLIAILVGIFFGIGAAIYFSNIKVKPETNSITTNTMEITPHLTNTATKLAEFTNLPKNELILNTASLKLVGKANNNTILFAANQTSLEKIVVKNKKFNHDFNLKPGLNDLILFEKNADSEQTKFLKLYYLASSNKVTTDKNEATNEAQILKQKLEKKVIELREKPKRALSGEVTAISEKQVSIKNGTNIEKIALEPEITNYLEVIDNNLTEITPETVTKGDTITAFVSEIAGDEKAYTLYLEPGKKVVVAKISNLDENNYNVTMINFDKATFGADVEINTTQQALDRKSQKLSEYGFSKLSIGQRILAILDLSREDYFFDQYIVIE